MTSSRGQTAAWTINHAVYTVQQLRNAILTGYNSSGNNLIIKNIMINDGRNGTVYSCGTVSSTIGEPAIEDIKNESNRTILYVTGKYVYS